MFWGKDAQEMAANCGLTEGDENHLVLMSSHPSPLSVAKGFSTCDHFNKANAYLKETGSAEIYWAGLLQ